MVEDIEARILGAPMTDTAAERVMEEKKIEMERMVDRLQHIDAHSAFYLLRNCLWIPKLQYILRAAPVYRWLDLLQPLDEALRAATASSPTSPSAGTTGHRQFCQPDMADSA